MKHILPLIPFLVGCVVVHNVPAPSSPLTNAPPRINRSALAAPMPPMPVTIPLSVQMRIAAQQARNRAAPFTTRFSVVKVDEKPLTEPGKDAEGIPDGTFKFTTNYIVTLQAVPIDETNAPVAWGAVKSGLLKLRIEFPVVIGDKLDLAPSSLPP